MKSILFLLFLLCSFSALSQSGVLNGRVVNGELKEGFAGVTLLLKQSGHVVTGTGTNQEGEFFIKDVPVGVYDITMEMIGYRSETLTNVSVSSTPLNLVIPFPGPCKYIYPDGKRLSCVHGHTDYIIPIAYGLPSRRTMRKAKKEQLHLGGCEVTDCDPKYYCLTHKVEL